MGGLKAYLGALSVGTGTASNKVGALVDGADDWVKPMSALWWSI